MKYRTKRVEFVNTDQLHSASMSWTCKQVYHWLSEGDDMDPAVQMMAALVLAKLLCEAKGFDLRTSLVAADRFVEEMDRKGYEQFKALNHYVDANFKTIEVRV